MTAKKSQPKPVFRGALAQDVQMFPTLGAVIPHKFNVEDVLDPGFWYQHIKLMEPLTRIRCEWECGSRSLVLRVMGSDAAAREVLVAIESRTEFAVPNLPAGYSIEFVNRAIGWRVLEEGRRAPRRSGFATAFAAARWLQGDTGPATAHETDEAKGEEETRAAEPKRPGGKKPTSPPSPPADAPPAPPA